MSDLGQSGASDSPFEDVARASVKAAKDERASLGRNDRSQFSRSAYFWFGYVTGVLVLGIAVIVIHEVLG